MNHESGPPTPPYNAFGKFLLMSLDKADRWTLRHSLFTAELSEILVGYSLPGGSAPENAWLAGLLHDIGKLGVESSILEKPGALSAEELAEMREHSFMGYRTLHRLFDHWTLSTAALHHHERFDGGGYPAGLSGADIPLLARFIAVADAYETIRSKRPYKPANDHDGAVKIVAEAAGSHFDPEVVSTFRLASEAVAHTYDKYLRFPHSELQQSVWDKLDQTRWAPF